MARERGPRPPLTPQIGRGAQPVLSQLDTPESQDTVTIATVMSARMGRQRLEGTGATEGIEKATGSLGSVGR